MRTKFKAVGIGISVELALIAAFAVGGFGPCGPASPTSTFVYFVHLPAFYFAGSLGRLEPLGLLFGLVVYAVIWSAVAHFFLELRQLRKS